MITFLFGIDSKAGNMERAETLVAAMEAEGLEATLGLYNMMMDGYAHSHNEAQCLAVFQKLKVRIESFKCPFLWLMLCLSV
jgi:pentatricopeptide repeat protein